MQKFTNMKLEINEDYFKEDKYNIGFVYLATEIGGSGKWSFLYLGEDTFLKLGVSGSYPVTRLKRYMTADNFHKISFKITCLEHIHSFQENTELYMYKSWRHKINPSDLENKTLKQLYEARNN